MSGSSHGAGDGNPLLAGRYRLGAQVRRTGTATVWQAQDEALGTPVEVRRLAPDSPLHVSPRARTVYSPRVTPVVDVLEQDDGTYVVSERLPGRTLEDALAQGPLSEAAAARLGLGVLDALEPVHAAGLAHGDLVPATVLLGDDGQVLLSGNGLVAVPEQAPWHVDLPAVGDLLQDAVGAPGSPDFAALLEQLGSPEPDSAHIRALLGDLAAGGADITEGAVPSGPAAALPSPREQTGTSGRRPSRRTAVVAALVLTCGAVLAGAFALASLGDREEQAPAGVTADDGAATPAAGVEPSRSAASPSAAPQQRPAPATALEPAAPVPARWSTYDDPDGAFSVAYPPGWRPDGDDADSARFVSGTGLSSLVVATRTDLGDVTDERVRAAEQAFAAEKQDYRLLRLEPTTFRGVPAYVWEATFTEDGVAQQASVVAFVADGRGHLLYLQSTERTWFRLDEVERDIRASYRVPG